jgi:outer membrane cobalamin receptor
MLALIVLSGPAVARAQVPGEVRGRVTDADGGRAISGARIQSDGGGASAVTEINGSFVLRGLDPRTLTLRIRAVGYVPHDTSVIIENGRTSVVNVDLQLAAPVLGRIVVQAARDTMRAPTFDRRAIEASGRRDLGELLQTVPGVVITQAGGPGSPSHVSIRGSGANEVLVLVDGNPINSAITGEADLSKVGLERIERVTVLPGAQSARYGGRALAGAVLIETRRPASEVSGMASTGAWGERNGSVSLGQTFTDGKVRSGGSITGDYRSSRGDFPYDVPAVRNGGVEHRANGDVQSAGVLASAFVDGTPGTLRFQTEWQTESRGTPGSIVQPSLTGREHDARVTGGLDGTKNFGAIVWTARVDGTRERVAFSDPTPPFGTAYDDVVDANSLGSATTLTVGSGPRSLTLGAEGRTIGVSSDMLAPDAPKRQRQVGTWLNARASHSISSGTDLTGELSARTDWDTFVNGAVFSPRVGVTLSHGRASLSGSFGGGFAPPSLSDQFFHEGVLVQPNPNLKPERVHNEVEVRGTLRDIQFAGLNVGGEASVFRSDIDGMILWQPDFRFIWSPNNFDVRRSGWEMSGQATAPSLDADIRGSLSRSDVTYTGSVLTGQVAYRPNTTGNVAVGTTRWSTRAEWSSRYVGARRTVAGSDLNLLDPYWLSDIKLSRSIIGGTWPIDATVGVENVFDRSAAMLVDYPFPGRTWTVAFRIRRNKDNTAGESIAGQK